MRIDRYDCSLNSEYIRCPKYYWVLIKLKGIEHCQACLYEALAGPGVSSVGTVLEANPLTNLSKGLVGMEGLRRGASTGWWDYHEPYNVINRFVAVLVCQVLVVLEKE